MECLIKKMGSLRLLKERWEGTWSKYIAINYDIKYENKNIHIILFTQIVSH